MARFRKKDFFKWTQFLTVKIRFYVINHSMRNMQIININTPH